MGTVVGRCVASGHEISKLCQILKERRSRSVVLNLYGKHYHNIDAKGRLSVPAKFREVLGSSLVIAISPDNCLRIYSSEQFDQVIAKLEEDVDTSSDEGRLFFDFFTSNASSCEIDTQGRIIVPPALRDYAGIKKEVVVVGAGKRADVWDKDTYEERFGDMDKDKFKSFIANNKLRLG